MLGLFCRPIQLTETFDGQRDFLGDVLRAERAVVDGRRHVLDTPIMPGRQVFQLFGGVGEFGGGRFESPGVDAILFGRFFKLVVIFDDVRVEERYI